MSVTLPSQVNFGMAILYMSVDLPSVSLMAHELAFMRNGRFIEVLP